MIFPDHFTFQSERLQFAPLGPSDFEDWAVCFSDPDVMKGLGGEPLDRASAWRSFAVMIGHWNHRGYGMFSLREKQTGAWAGRVGPWYPEGWFGHEIGWTIARPHWGKGFAGEAARATMDFARDHLGWRDIIHVIAPDNHNSRRIAEKLGSTLLGSHDRVPGFPGDYPVNIWGQSLSVSAPRSLG